MPKHIPGLGIIFSLMLLFLLGCPIKSIDKNICPVGSVPHYGTKATSQCGGDVSMSVLEQKGQLAGLCTQDGNQTVYCEPFSCKCGVKFITKERMECMACYGSAEDESKKPGNGDSIVLSASLICQKRNGNIYENITVTTQTYSGCDRIKLYFKTDSVAYIYVILQNEADSVVMLFPEPASSNMLGSNTEYIIPPGTDWWIMDEPGKTFRMRVIASVSTVEELESYRQGEPIPGDIFDKIKFGATSVTKGDIVYLEQDEGTVSTVPNIVRGDNIVYVDMEIPL